MIGDAPHFRLGDAIVRDGAPARPRTRPLPVTADHRALCRRLAKASDLGELVVLLAALAALLQRYDQGETVVIDTPPLSGRDASGQLQRVVSIAITIDDAWSLRQLVLATRQAAIAAYDHPEPSPGAGPRSDVLVVHPQVHAAQPDTDHDFVVELGNDVTLYDRRGLLDDDASRRLGEQFDRIVAQLAALDAPLAGLRLLDERETAALRALGERTDQPALRNAPPLPQLFAATARAHADQIAVIAEGITLSYRELETRALQLAHHLNGDLGVRHGDSVGVACDRSEHAIVALLGVLAAGAVYVPLDPQLPRRRLARMFGDADVRALVVHSRHLEVLNELSAAPTVCLDLQAGQLAEASARSPVFRSPTDPAAIIFTSGSEGAPKGVVLDHRGLANVALDHITELELGPGDRYLQFMALSFDGSLLDILTGVLSGAALVMVDQDTLRSAHGLTDQIERHAVTALTITPSYLALLDPARLGSVRAIISAAEPARSDDAERHAHRRWFYNGYGPTEGCVNVTLHRVQPGRHYTRVPIGRPRANKQVYVIDRHHRLLPRGAIGEIAISGCGITSKYLHDPELTARKFIAHPFRPGERLYLSGDLGAWNEHGELCFEGRRDEQVKLRGFRVEPGEIEQALRDHGGIGDAAVVVDTARQRLVAFVTGTASAQAGELTAYLRTRLPDYMIPAIAVIAKLPRTSSGKIDRRALLDRAGAISGPVAPPRDAIEADLVEIWRTVLGLPEVSSDADFFQLGGDSIRIIQVVLAAHERSLDLDTVDVIRHRTVQAIAAHLRARRAEAAVAETAPRPASTLELEIADGERRAIIGDYEDVYPVSRMQAMMLRHHADPAARRQGVYHCLASWQFEDASLSLTALVEAVTALVRRHRCLRTDYIPSPVSDRFLQIVRPVGAAIAQGDISALDPRAQDTALQRLADDETARGHGPCAPLVRFHVVRRSERTVQLVMSAHHAVIDGWSAVVLENELIDRYLAIKAGDRTVDADPPAVDAYRQFVALEHELVQSDEQAAFWRAALAGAAAPRAPNSSPVTDDEFGHIALDLDDETTRGFGRIAEEVTLKAACLEGWLTALHQITGLSRLTVGLIANGRSKLITDPLNATGLFWNVVPFPSHASADTAAVRARSVHDRLLEIEPFARYPLDAMLDDSARQAPFHASFNFVQFHHERAAHPGIRLVSFEGRDRFHYPISVTVVVPPHTGPISVRLDYRTAYLDHGAARALLDRFIAHGRGHAADRRHAADRS